MKQTLPKLTIIALCIAFWVLLINTITFVALCSADPGWHTMALNVARFISAFACGYTAYQLWDDWGKRRFNKKYAKYIDETFPSPDTEGFRKFAKNHIVR